MSLRLTWDEYTVLQQRLRSGKGELCVDPTTIAQDRAPSRTPKQDRAKPYPTEAHEQKALIAWIWKVGVHRYPELDGVAYAIPNGGYRLKSEAAELTRLGVIPGLPDLHFAISRGTYHSLYLEMKAQNGTPSPLQLTRAQCLARQGNVVAFAWGWEMGRDTLCWYLDLPKVL